MWFQQIEADNRRLCRIRPRRAFISRPKGFCAIFWRTDNYCLWQPHLPALWMQGFNCSLISLSLYCSVDQQGWGSCMVHIRLLTTYTRSQDLWVSVSRLDRHGCSPFVHCHISVCGISEESKMNLALVTAISLYLFWNHCWHDFSLTQKRQSKR